MLREGVYEPLFAVVNRQCCNEEIPLIECLLITSLENVMRLLVTFALCVAFLSQQAALAGPAADNLSSCMQKNTSEQDRKDLARWTYSIISVNPALKGMAVPDAQARIDSEKAVGAFLTRLLAKKCLAEARAAGKSEGNEGIKSAFQVVGQLGAMELMAHPSVNSASKGITRYMDTKALDAALNK